MSQTQVKTPDGSTILVIHPEGASQDQILKFAQQQYSPPVESKPLTGPGIRPVRSPFGTIPGIGPADFGEGVLDFLKSGAASFAGGVTGGIAALSGADFEKTAQIFEKTSGNVAGLFQPSTLGGQQTSELLAKPFEFLERGAHRAGEIVDDPAASTAIKTALLGIPALFAGTRGRGGKLTVKQQTALTAQEAGYKIPPGSSGGIGVQAAEGLVGRPKIRMEAAQENVAVHNKLANRALGLPEDVPLSVAGLEALRAEAGKAYAVIDNTGTIVADISHRRGVSKAVSDIQRTSKDFPSVAGTESLIDQLLAISKDMQKAESFSAQSARGLIDLMRGNADNAFRNGHTSIGRSYRDLSKVMEDTIDRHLARTGSPEVVQAYRDARQQIAKSYSVQEALDGDGIVVPAKLKQQLQRGVPLTGELKLIAKTNEQFPQSTAITPTIKEGAAPFSVFDAALGLGGVGLAVTNPALAPLAAFAFGRPFVRQGLLSKPGQALATPGPTHPLAIPGLLGSAELAGQ